MQNNHEALHTLHMNMTILDEKMINETLVMKSLQ